MNRSSLLRVLTVDAACYTSRDIHRLREVVRLYVVNPGFRAVVLYRIGHRASLGGHARWAAVIEAYMRRSCHCTISCSASIGPGLLIAHVGAIVVGSGVIMGTGCSIRQGVTIGGSEGRTSDDGRTQPTIGDGVLIGAGAVVVGPISVGDRVVVGANVVLRESIPAGSRVLPAIPFTKDRP